MIVSLGIIDFGMNTDTDAVEWFQATYIFCGQIRKKKATA
jgi:hypothetical protein